jgi:pyruvate-formate lyase
MRNLPKYGNDIDEVDDMLTVVHDHVCGYSRSLNIKGGLHSYLVVNINNHANAILGRHTGASADGRKKGTPMANANNPSSGCDTNGVTAFLNSIVKPAVDVHAGSVQNMKFSKDIFKNHSAEVRALLSTYFSNGGSQAMINVIGRDDLENAMKFPEEYANLIVRVGGFTARFVELDRDVQEEILNRTLY